MDLKKICAMNPDLVEQLRTIPIDPFVQPPLLSAKIKLLWGCNLSCVFCNRLKNNDILSRDTVQIILRKLHAAGLQKIHFSGGEIFLHPDIIEILSDACSMGLQVNCTTNGTLLNKEKIVPLADIGIHGVCVSLDGAASKTHDHLRNKKGAFKATCKTLQLLGRKAPRIRLSVNTVVTRFNAEEIGSIHELLLQLPKPPVWNLLPVDSTDKKLRLRPEMAQKLSEQSRNWTLLRRNPFGTDSATFKQTAHGEYGCKYHQKMTCFVPWLHLFIEPSGNVYPCCMMRQKIPSLGILPNATIEQLRNSGAMRKIRMSIASGNIPSACSHCDDFVEENVVLNGIARDINSD